MDPGTRLSDAPAEPHANRYREYGTGDTSNRDRACGGESTACRATRQRHGSPSTGCSYGAMCASVPIQQLIVIARDDDTTFGILHSRFHEVWSLRLGTWLGKGNDPRYTPTTTFETFPFPPGLTPDIPTADYAADPRAMAVALEARRLVELRDRWLNPPEWVEWVDEPVPGYPKRPVPRDEDAAMALKKRTLTNLYNARPQWLADAHEALDAAVAAAYGWSADITDDDVLQKLLAMNMDSTSARASN